MHAPACVRSYECGPSLIFSSLPGPAPMPRHLRLALAVELEVEGMIELTLTATGVLESNQMSAARAVRRRYYWHGGACLATMRKLRRRPRSPSAVHCSRAHFSQCT